MDLAGKPIVVVGLARSGIAVAEFLARRGARVLASDLKSAVDLPEEALRLIEKGVRLETGGHSQAALAGAFLTVVSPGVPFELPQLAAARQAGVPVIAEIELAYRFLRGTVVAITGTKGKSTTTAALGSMLREAGREARVGGNIGAPLIGLVDGSTEHTVFAVEVSSFQLEGIVTFRPRVAVFLNFSPDHLDRHPTLESYAAAKGRIFENQTSADWAVVNLDDPGVMALAARGRARVMPIRVSGGDLPGERGGFFSGKEARLRFEGRTETLFRLGEVRLPGAHLAGDLLAAAAAARLVGVPAEAIARAAAAFRGVEHVLEHVADAEGVSFFNDSKATNIEAARRSLESFDRGVVAIMGGRYKGGDFADLADVVRRNVTAIMAIGEAKGRIVAALGTLTRVTPCQSMEEAVDRALVSARPGQVVLLAPACSSFDMFRDYADRGRVFKAEVRRLVDRGRVRGGEAHDG